MQVGGKTLETASSGAPSGASAPIKSAPAQTNPPEGEEQLPRSFGRLTLLKKIARGGMGEVYLAYSGGIEGAERPCVVKVIRKEHAGDRSFLARFLDEARIQAQFQHPGVAQILEAATDEEQHPFHVVEYIEGRNLSEVRQRSTQLKVGIGWADAVAVAISMCDALAHVHGCTDPSGRPLEIVHRDLSPQNVMVGYGGDVKLIDFGTARGENRRCQTVAGVVYAKPGYVAPEVANETPGDVPADLYAVGVMLWELVAGRRFLMGEAAAHMAAVARGERNPTAIATENGAPSRLDTVIARLTAPRIEDRYLNAVDATRDLIRVLKEAPSLANGERSVRGRIAHLMGRLWPAEPARSRGEFARLVGVSQKRSAAVPPGLPESDAAPARVVNAPAKPASSARRLAPSAAEPAGDVVSTQAAEPAPGDRMLEGTRYELIRRIASGPMSEVHQARHVDLGRNVALKLLPKDRGSSPDFERRFREEAHTAASLRHENLVDVYDFGITSSGAPFIAMELLEGESLDTRLLREGPMSWRRAALLGVQACKALEAAHAAGIVHRDIKPGNLFTTASGELKLLDFGVAKVAQTVEPSEGESEAIELVGTPEYMAPEQIRSGGAEVDARVDVYALGAVLYELITGRLPHVASSTAQLLDQKLNSDPDAPSKRAPTRTKGLPTMLDNTIQQSLAREPEYRYQTAEELREALEHALEEPTRRQKRRRAIAYGVLGGLSIALGLGFFVGSRNPEIRSRAVAVLAPVAEKLDGLRGAPPAGQAAALPAAKVITVKSDGTAHVAAADPGALPEPAPAAEQEAPVEAAEQPAEVAELVPEDAIIDLDALDDAEKGDAPKADAEPKLAAVDGEQGGEAAAADSEPAPDSKEAILAEKIVEAQDMMRAGKRIKGLNKLRRLGKNNRKDKRVLRAWSLAAESMKNWGEAHRVARQWASVDDGVEAQIQHARLQRAVGKRDHAIKTLAKLLQSKPDCGEARELVRAWGGKSQVALR